MCVCVCVCVACHFERKKEQPCLVKGKNEVFSSKAVSGDVLYVCGVGVILERKNVGHVV